MSDSILKIDCISYCYEDGTQALKDVSIDIQRGKTTAILGSNGAGKSTLFLHFNGILKPASGAVYYNGNAMDYSRESLNKLRQTVGIVFQDPDNQLFSASVLQDVSFGPMNLKLPEETIRSRVYKALEHTGISDLIDKPTHSLSYGQKKRVAIAGILAMEPKLLVLDEPTAGLDPKGVTDLMRMLKRAQEDLGLSIVIATHDIDLVPLYCDYVYAMNSGEVAIEGTPKDVFDQKEALRSINLRLSRIGHLMEILALKDGFELEDTAITLSQARRVLKLWRSMNRK